MNSVSNQRVLKVNKSKTDKRHIYTMNNIAALDTAAGLLQTKGGFKLYMYLAKHQDKHSLALSSKDFMEWSGLGYTAYTSAFEELVDKKFLVRRGSDKIGTYYDFYDTPKETEENVFVCYEDNMLKYKKFAL